VLREELGNWSEEADEAGQDVFLFINYLTLSRLHFSNPTLAY